MPAGLPGDSPANNLGNPNAGRFVMMDALSGPKGSPFDKDPAGKASTGAMSTGIGFGGLQVININSSVSPATAPRAITLAGFTDDQTIAGSGVNSSRIYIGGGRSNATLNGIAVANPYTAGFIPVGAGNGGSRDAGAGPAFTGFTSKMVTATATVANGAAIEAGFVNRTGQSMAIGSSAFGSSTAAQAAPS